MFYNYNSKYFIGGDLTNKKSGYTQLICNNLTNLNDIIFLNNFQFNSFPLYFMKQSKSVEQK